MAHNRLILIFSSTIPVAIFILYITPKYYGITIDFLPLLNACINGIVFFILFLAILAIKNGKEILHKKLMTTALILSIIFLVSYVLHHATHESVSFEGNGIIKYIYYFILISHISLSIIIIPFVLITFSKALKEKFIEHKKIAKITLPIWLYVCLTGVIIYLMISPYY